MFGHFHSMDANAQAAAGLRKRRGSLNVVISDWRRCLAGPNRISNIGVWAPGTRRGANRANRMGETGWHRSYRARQVDDETRQRAP
jgi:hypothetical protein